MSAALAAPAEQRRTTGIRLEAPLLGLITGWVATWSWAAMVERPGRYLLLALVLGLLVVLAGAGLRRVPRLSAPAVAGGQLLTALLGLHLAVAGDVAPAGVVPTPASVAAMVDVLGRGAATLDQYAAPVARDPAGTSAVLLACALGLLLTVELLLTWWRRPALVAVPLLAALSIPVSVLQKGLALPVFVGTALLFVRLLGVRDGGSGQQARSGVGVLWQVALAAVVAALVVAPVVPVTNLLDQRPGDQPGTGPGGDFTVTSVNPFLRLHRDLVAQTHTPLVRARTEAPSTSYLRTTVLDEFTPEGWGASERNLPAGNTADGYFPSPPGLAPGTGGQEYRWSLELAPQFLTTWLPLPYAVRSVHVNGDWRYDTRTLDVTMAAPVATSGMRYSVVAFEPEIDAAALQGSPSAPAKVQVPYTQVPRSLPAAVLRQARAVTKGTHTDFERAVALQEWFRHRGGFRYSLRERTGSGMDLLAHFVTDDRVGYCEQYAAAMAAMGRALGIPSRVVVGFLDGTTQNDGRVLYTSDDRHAWPEMYFTGVGWVRFEPTPSERAGATPAWTRQDLSPRNTARPTPRAQQLPRRAPAAEPTTAEAGGQGVPWGPVTGLVLIGLLAALPGAVRRAQRRRRLGAADPDKLVEGAWAELRATAVDLGVEWPDGRSPREQAHGLAEQVPAARRRIQVPVEELLVAVERSRYGPPGATVLTADQRVRTAQTVANLRATLLDGTRRQRGWWTRVWPASVWPAPWRRGSTRARPHRRGAAGGETG